MLLLIIQLSGARVLEEYQASEVSPLKTFQAAGKTLPRNDKSVKNSASTFIEAGGEETRQTIESEQENRAPHKYEDLDDVISCFVTSDDRQKGSETCGVYTCNWESVLQSRSESVESGSFQS